jgi:hypothetical protein
MPAHWLMVFTSGVPGTMGPNQMYVPAATVQPAVLYPPQAVGPRNGLGPIQQGQQRSTGYSDASNNPPVPLRVSVP